MTACMNTYIHTRTYIHVYLSTPQSPTPSSIQTKLNLNPNLSPQPQDLLSLILPYDKLNPLPLRNRNDMRRGLIDSDLDPLTVGSDGRSDLEAPEESSADGKQFGGGKVLAYADATAEAEGVVALDLGVFC